MVRNLVRSSIAAIILAAFASASHAAPPYSLDFSAGTSGWRFATTETPATALTTIASGGAVDGGAFIRKTMTTLTGTNPMSPTTALMFRAHKTYSGIDTDFSGNWMAVEEVRAWVRHDAPDPLPFVGRFAATFNSPAAFYTESPLVQPNVWTELVFTISPASPDLTTYEAGTYYDVFQGFDGTGVSNMQFGVSIPASLAGTGPYNFDFDKVSIITPEPGSAALAAFGLAGLGLFVRRKSR